MNQQSINQQGMDQGRNQYPQNQNQQTGDQDSIGGLQGTSNKGSNSNDKKQHFLVDQTPISQPNQLELNTTSQPASSSGRASNDELKHNKTVSETSPEETNGGSSGTSGKKGKGSHKTTGDLGPDQPEDESSKDDKEGKDKQGSDTNSNNIGEAQEEGTISTMEQDSMSFPDGDEQGRQMIYF